MTSILFEHRDEFDDRNPFLQVALGLLSCATAVEKKLPQLEATATRAVGDDRLDPALGFLLGIASVASTVRRLAAAAATPETVAGPHVAEPSTAPALRRLLEF